VYNALLSVVIVVIPFQFRDFDMLNVGLHVEVPIVFDHSTTYAMLGVLSMLSGPLVLIFLPWTKSEFCIRSGGFPTLRIHRVIMFSEVCVSLVRLIVVITSCAFSVIAQLSILTASIQFVLYIIHICVKLRKSAVNKYQVENKIYHE
jgi:hypothetical protein